MNLNTGQVEDSFLEINDRAGDSGDFGIGALQLVGDYLVAMNTKADNELLLIDTSTSRLAGQIDLNQLFDYMNEILQQDKIAALEREKSVSAIAWDSKQKTLFVVGLDWPFIFELKFSDRTFARKPVKNHNGKSV
jgi:glutamine cyclotransferase